VIEHGRFFVPGPTEVRPELLSAMCRPLIFHRGAAMRELMERVTTRLSVIFGTRRPVHVITGSGTAAMDLTARSGTILRVLSIVHGDFGERFARICEACGRSVTRLPAEPGETVPLDRIRAALAAGNFDAVTATHSETATGTLADIAGIGEVVREFDACVFLVDAVSSAGATPVRMDDWGADAVVSASQKAMALPPGLAFAAVSEKLVERARGMLDRGTYLDVLRYEEFTSKRESPTTPAVSLLYALDQQLSDIEAEGLDARHARHLAMQRACVEWAERAGHERGGGPEIVAREGARSPSVICLRTEKAPRVLARMREHGFDLGGGQGALAGTSFRIGHMGDHSVAGIEAMLGVLESVLQSG
jgi:aspartate aminotransferase-like enzyme